jgi:putative ABC transport system permease protein
MPEHQLAKFLVMQRMSQLVRRLAGSPLFTVITVVTLGLSIGANTAIFSVVEGVLLKPLPFPSPEELVGAWHSAPGLGITDLNQSPSNYFTYREENQSFADFGLYNRRNASVTELGDPEQVQTLVVTDGTLPLLGIRPLLGRLFTANDDKAGSPETVILTFGYWQRKFGGDHGVIGRRIMVDSKAHEIIGVLPDTFHLLDFKPSLVLPQQFDRSKAFLGNFSFRGVARLKKGVTIQRANEDITRMLPHVLEKFPPPPGFRKEMFEQARIVPNLRPLEKDVIGDVAGTLWVLMGTVGVVLLIACANVANLLLIRAEGRQQELAIRAALGAGIGRIARALLAESLALAIAGGALGLVLAYAALKLLLRIAPAGLPRLEEISINGTVILFTAGVSIFSGMLFGSVPVFKYLGPGLTGGLRHGGRSFSLSRHRHRVQNTLVIVQVALALVLVIGSGLMIRTLWAMKDVPPGFSRPEQVQTFRVAIPEALVKDPERVARMFEDMLERVRQIPGVTEAGLASAIPMDGRSSNDLVFAQDRTYAPGEIPPIRRFKFISPGFFQAMGSPLIAGRDITWTDIYGRRPVGIVSVNFAREYWGSPQAALGKRIREGMKDDWREIVGVVGNLRDDGVNKPEPAAVYWPLMMGQFWGDQTFVIRQQAFAIRTGRAGSEALLNEARSAIWSVNASLPLSEVATLEEIYEKSMARVSFTLVLLATASGMALLLGLVGIYGVISYSVFQRTREIGIRMALGAGRGELTGMFLRKGLTLTGIGVAVGLGGAIATTRWMASLLFGVKAIDLPTYAVVVALIAAAAALASYVPSRRAATAMPLEALRVE